jgi:hypothetical protein
LQYKLLQTRPFCPTPTLYACSPALETLLLLVEVGVGVSVLEKTGVDPHQAKNFLLLEKFAKL